MAGNRSEIFLELHGYVKSDNGIRFHLFNNSKNEGIMKKREAYVEIFSCEWNQTATNERVKWSF